ncbi:MAG: response regulator [Methylococcales bacterium]|nr:response regulator [Methylococcales bacterium]
MKKSIDFAQRQIHELQQSGKAPPLFRQLDQELYYASYIHLTGKDSSLMKISQAVKSQLVEHPSAQQFFIEQVVAQVNDIVAKNSALFLALDETTQYAKKPLTQEFDEALHAYFDAKQKTDFYIQSFLFIISILSIIYATYLLVKLSRKENALKTALSDIGNLQHAFDQHAIISFSDAEGNFTRVNEKFCTLSEYTEQELIGKNHWLMHSGENSEAVYLDMMDSARNGLVWHGELQSKSHTGKPYWVYATIVPFVNEARQLYQLISIRTDITLSKRLAAEITESKNFVQKLTDTMAQGVYAVDRNGRCTFWNKRAEHLLGWTQREMMMQPLVDLIVYQDNEDAIIVMDDAFMDASQIKTMEIKVLRKNGGTFPVSVTIAPLNENRKIIGFVVVFQDISETKEQQRLLHEAMQAAESANQTKSAFLANMSHEIRTPMNGIIGMTDLALDTELTVEQREFLSIAKNSANALLTIINDILDFSKIEAGKLELDAVEFDLHQVMRETIKNLSLRAYQKGLEMILDTATDVPRYLIGDSGRLGQIIINLIGNAIKFTEHGEIILRIRLHSQKDEYTCLQFVVEDSGIGIPEDSQKDVFSSFSQVDASVFRKYGGTGLGLSIAKQLVELMRGKIGVTSQLNKGTSFHFTAWFKAPLHDDERIMPLSTLSSVRVLVVDDNARLRNLMGHTLTGWGMDVLAVKNATEALGVLRQEKGKGRAMQLIVVDEELPDIDGFTMVDRLQQENLSSAPIIMLLSSIYSAGRSRNGDAKIACVISKPASQSDLLDAVHTVFDGPVANALATQDLSRHEKILQPLDILLAEDNAINQQLAVRLLEKQGHTVSIANNGQECLDKLAKHAYDVVLMDFQMPVMDGLEATRRIRQLGLDIPVIAMTANAMKGDRERALESGMNDYLTKPIKVTELFEVIGRYFPEVDYKIMEPLDILLAEDNVINQQLAVRLLEKQGHTVSLAVNGQECLDKLAEHTYDLVLMDFQMPIMDGLEATRRIRQQGLNIPIIAITANALKGDRQRALDAGMNDYLTKPIKANVLFDVISRHFATRKTDSTASLPEPNRLHRDGVAVANKSPVVLSLPEEVATPICDWKNALALLGGDSEILIDMAKMYISNADSYVSDIAHALEQRNASELPLSLHTLKGIFALFKAGAAEQLLITVEHAAQNGEIAVVAKALPDITSYAKALMVFLQEKLESNR